jgi:hypothetical protein
MQLYQLLYGKSKTKMKVIMIDEKKKCENYMKSREPNVKGWHKIELAPAGSDMWRQKSSTIGGNGNNCGPVKINRHGKNQIQGYISKQGFVPHT